MKWWFPGAGAGGGGDGELLFKSTEILFGKMETF